MNFGKCLSTRDRKSGVVYRRYDDGSGVKTTTLEVPASVLREMGVGRMQAALARWERGQALRVKAATLRQSVLAQAGVKAAAIAHELGVTESRVRQIRQAAAALDLRSSPTSRTAIPKPQRRLR